MRDDDAHAVIAEVLEAAPMADLLAGYCLDVQPRQKIVVRSSVLATPLLLELQRAILQRDAWVRFDVELPGQSRGFYEHARDLHLDDFDDMAMGEAKLLDAEVGRKIARANAVNKVWPLMGYELKSKLTA